MAAAPLSPLPPQYDPFVVEAKWQERWEAAAAFRADPQAPGPTYCIVIPPPNVTGSLHMGHAFNMSLIDTLTRYHRMQGYNTLCLPGTDHASIAVQTLVEKDLKTKDGKTRADIGREAFLERAWTWRADYGGQIVGQFRQLGVSLDWSRERFTMDEMLSKAVLEAFVRLYEEGLIYRGNYLVNWCPASQSAVSDLELEAKDVQGHLWYFRYPLSDGSGSLVVATTRPETMLGDTGVAVNPNDERYRALIGQTLTLPLVGRRIPIVADELVDPAFGTGCVKVTPAHDPNDFEMGKRHQLPFITVMNKDGTMNEQAGEFQGLDRFAARKAVVGALEAQGFLDKIEPYTHTVPHSDRGGVPVEPLLSTQWFVKIDGLAATAREALDRMEPAFVPERWTKVYRDWLGNLRDWCISRQLWWGHQIPAWYAVSETDGAIADQTPFVVARSEAEAIEAAQAQFGTDVVLERDPDVLDTWFSSGLWPFSTLGWPNTTADLQRYYPTSTLVTGFDIIFFWVARMTMMAGYFTGQMPFKDVYIHGLVRDETGQKMSKSKGNVVDPRLLMDCYGTDAMRYTLIRDVAGAGQDISLQLNRAVYELKLLQKKWPTLAETATSDGELVQQLLQSLPLPQQSALVRELKKVLPKQSPEALMGEVAQALGRMAAGQEAAKTPAAKAIADLQATSLSDSVEAARNFTNKLWNASRFVMMNLDGLTPAQLGEPSVTTADGLADRWILSRFQRSVEQTCASIEQYGLGEAVKGLYEFIWGDFCDWYIELVKTRLQDKTPEGAASRLIAQRILAYVLDGILRLIHPFMPHISEEIWHSLNHQDESVFLALQSYPALKADWIDPGLEKDFELLIGVIRVARNLRAEVGVKPGAKVPLLLLSEDPDERNLLAIATTPLQDLAKAETVTLLTPDEPTPQKSFVGVVGTVQVLLPLEGLVDLDALKLKLQKNLTKVEAEIQSLSTRLSNPGFVNKAPEDVIAIARASLAEAQEQAKILQSRIERL